MDISVLGIDLGKNSCSVVGLDATGKVVTRRRMRRETVVVYAAKLPRCVVAMEACCGAHHMGRVLTSQGPHRKTDVAGVCPTICKSAEERRP